MASVIAVQATPKKKTLATYLFRDRWLYILLAPGALYFLIFKYLPMWGVIIAFQDYSPFLGVFKSSWVGFQNFTDFFINPDFVRLIVNTLILSALNLVFFFPMPIILALMLNELGNQMFKRTVQTIIYVPHFISMVIVVSITYVLLNVMGGPVNGILQSTLGHKVDFLGSPAWFRPLIIIQVIWKETGWGTIIFLAAIAGVDQELYEAAIVDGAGRLRQLLHVTLPAILPTIVVMLIMRMGYVLDNGFEQIFLMRNSLNGRVADVFDVYVYNMGITQGAFSYSTAVGLFKAVVGLILVKSSDLLAKRVGQSGIL
jgi:putative aldouronate transport system permease protein